jgi:aldehyde dehydrogenase (NAD+)
MELLRVGAPLDKSVDMGAIVAPVQLARIRELVAQGVAEGASCWQPTWAEPKEGWFYPPTLFTNVEPSATIAQVEIFGPVLVTHTFRTPDEAVQLANNTPYGLAASVWSDDINLALDIAPRLRCGVVWINSTNAFDASAGFGGYRESGYGREGGREGMWEYVKPMRASLDTPVKKTATSVSDAITEEHPVERASLPSVDRTPKLYIGGQQARPDSGYSLPVHSAKGRLLGEVGDGNRKDIRNAVEAAHAASAWGRRAGHARAQVLYYIAENLSARAREFAARIAQSVGVSVDAGEREVEQSISRLFTYAAWADKHDGAVHDVPMRAVSLAMHEPLGVVGVVCPPTHPLLGFVSLIAPLVATGNTVVAVPSDAAPLVVTDFYGVLDTSDVPGGVINIVTGQSDALAKVLADHDNVDALWYCGSHAGATAVEQASVGNLKQTWAEWTPRDWSDARLGEGREFLRRATQVKNIWIPYGA